MAKLELLKPKIKELAEKLIAECKKLGHQIAIAQTLRTIEEQDALYAQGRTKPGNIVTWAKGGESFHNFGVAFDFCPLVNGKLDWNNLELFKKIGTVGKSLGLEWGGDWPKPKTDLPHFEYKCGFTLKDFQGNKVDWKKFELSSVNSIPVLTNPQITFPALKVTSQDGLNVRGGPGTDQAKLGKLAFSEIILPLEKTSGWVKIKYGNSFGWVSESYLA